MAAALITFDKNSEYGAALKAALQGVRNAIDGLIRARAVAIQACDGATDQAVNFHRLAAVAGFVAGDYADANAAAKASFDEVDSLWFKLTKTDGDAVGLAVPQACAKHGVV